MQEIYFSIVIPLYNKERYIFNTIKSIQKQTYPYFEILIVNDGSTDRSLDIVKSITDTRIRILTQENQGVSIARNNGIFNAKYQYIAFIDADDCWHEKYLEYMSIIINKYPNVMALGVEYTRFILDNKNIENIEVIDHLVVIKDYFDYLIKHGHCLTASSTIINKNLFEKIGNFPEKLKNWEDLDMWGRVGMVTDIMFLNVPLVLYNKVEGSGSCNLSNLHAPIIDNPNYYIDKFNIRGNKLTSYREYVAQMGMYSIYESYLINRKKIKALKNILKYRYTKLYKKRFISIIIQFIISPELFNLLMTIKKKH